MTNSASFYLRVMSLVAEHEAYDSLFWRTDGTYAPITLFIRCNDLFYWAMADLEEITPENVRELALALEDATGHRAVILTSDLLGMPQSIYRNTCAALKAKYGF
mgnify:CR=1 FL=1